MVIAASFAAAVVAMKNVIYWPCWLNLRVLREGSSQRHFCAGRVRTLFVPRREASLGKSATRKLAAQLKATDPCDCRMRLQAQFLSSYRSYR
jgi:hypothetical protein